MAAQGNRYAKRNGHDDGDGNVSYKYIRRASECLDGEMAGRADESGRSELKVVEMAVDSFLRRNSPTCGQLDL